MTAMKMQNCIGTNISIAIVIVAIHFVVVAVVVVRIFVVIDLR